MGGLSSYAQSTSSTTDTKGITIGGTSSPLEKMPVLPAFPEELDIDISKVWA
jgi:hypothetical protein